MEKQTQMMVIRQNILSTIILKMSDFTWQHLKYSRPEIYVGTLVLLGLHVVRQNILRTIMLQNVISPGNIRSILGQ